MATTIVLLPEPAQTVLAANIPYLEVDGWIGRRERDCSHVLTNGGDGF